MHETRQIKLVQTYAASYRLVCAIELRKCGACGTPCSPFADRGEPNSLIAEAMAGEETHEPVHPKIEFGISLPPLPCETALSRRY